MPLTPTRLGVHVRIAAWAFRTGCWFMFCCGTVGAQMSVVPFCPSIRDLVSGAAQKHSIETIDFSILYLLLLSVLVYAKSVR